MPKLHVAILPLQPLPFNYNHKAFIFTTFNIVAVITGSTDGIGKALAFQVSTVYSKETL